MCNRQTVVTTTVHWYFILFYCFFLCVGQILQEICCISDSWFSYVTEFAM